MPSKTNAVRLLDQLGIGYELREYEVDPEDLAAESVATKIGLLPQQVFKTLVARGDRNGICIAVIPGDSELDLKAMAAASGNRKIQLVPVKELQALTGYVRGGVTAMATQATSSKPASAGVSDMVGRSGIRLERFWVDTANALSLPEWTSAWPAAMSVTA